ncbi:MAG TPA: tyrosine-type recombinase/integrase [Chloroflexota bacterium]|nr:tyrosine-type recombinase/integrase [Chloroflexota bacterium]
MGPTYSGVETLARPMMLGDSGESTRAQEDRAARAVAAARARDTRALVALTDQFLTAQGSNSSPVSVHTRRAYGIGIRMLVADWREEDLLRPRQGAALNWLRRLERDGAWHQNGTVGPATPSTVRVRLAAGRALYRALRWAGATSADPFQDLRAAPEPAPSWDKTKPYSEADVAALFAVATPLDQAIVLLGSHAGLRVAEMCGLYGRDLDLASGRLTVRSEIAGRQREVAMSPSLVRTLDRLGWVADRPLLGLTDSGVRKRLLRLCARAGIQYRGAHALRHAAGTRVLRGGGSLEDVAHHLGHSNRETARVYAKWVATADREEAADGGPVPA